MPYSSVSSPGSRVFISNPNFPSFHLNFESMRDSIVTEIFLKSSHGTLYPPPSGLPFNSTATTAYLNALKICGTSSPRAPVSINITLSIKPPGATLTRSSTTLFNLTLLDDIPVFNSSSSPGTLIVFPLNAISPQLLPQVTSTPTAPTVYPWAYSTYISWTSDAPAALSSIIVTIDSGCVPGDNLTFPSSTTAQFFGSINSNKLCGLVLRGTGNLKDYLTVLESLQFTPSTNPYVASPRLLRVIKFEFVNFVTLFTTVAVQSSASPSIPTIASSSSLLIKENLPPDFAVAVMRDCPPSPTAIHGVPTVCFESKDPAFFRAAEDVGAYAGATAGPLLMQKAVSFIPAFSSLGTSLPCAPTWSALAIGDAVSDCTSTPPDASEGSTHPVLCYWQRYRVVLPSGSASFSSGSAACGLNCSLDFEAICSTSSSPPTPTTLTLNASLTLTATLLPAVYDSSASTSSSAVSLILRLVGTPELPSLAWPDAPTLQSLNFAAALAPLPPFSPLRIDDTTGQPNSTVPRFFFCSQDNSTFYASLSLAALEGANNATLPSMTSTPSRYFSFVALAPPTRLWLNDAPSCAAALSLNPAMIPASWVYVTPLTLNATNPSVLRTLPARTLGLRVQPYTGSSTVSAPLLLPVTITRANRPVAWVNTSTASLSLAEDAAVGSTAAGILSVTDSDVEQDVTFTVFRTTLTSCNGKPPLVSYTVPDGLFVPAPLNSTLPIFDIATGATTVVNSTRSMRVAVGVDNLGLNEAAGACGITTFAANDTCIYTLRLRATDNGNPTPSHSLLPLQPKTSSTLSLNLTVRRIARNSTGGAISAFPTVTSIEGVPPLGLSTGGGDKVTLVGTGLIVPFTGNSNTIAATFYNASTPFPLFNCRVLLRLTRIQCTTSPGFGVVSRLSLQLGSFVYSFPPSLRLPAFQLPRVLAVLPQGAGNQGSTWNGVLPTMGPPSPSSDLQSLLRASPSLAYLPSPANITLLVDGTGPVPGITATVWASIQLGSASYLPLGVCAPSPAFGVNASALLDRGYNTPSILASASWFDCPLPALLGAGAYRQLQVRVTHTRNESAAASPPFSPFWPTTTPPSLAWNASQQWWGGLPGVIQPVVAIPPRAPPSITSVSQSTPGGGFTVTGRGLGYYDLAWHSDRIEYAFINSSSGLPLGECALPSSVSSSTPTFTASCSIHRGVDCWYSTPHKGVQCEMEVGGWGSGFAVRAVVGGQTSPWVPSNLTYGGPTLSTFVLPTILGGANGAPSSTVLEPSGGGLLVLQGTNLWPPQALVVTMGGVRVYPINTRPIPASLPSIFNCNPNATGRVVLVPSPTSNTSTRLYYPSPGCSSFGDASVLWKAGNDTTGRSLLLTYPPGFGTVTLEVSLGLFTASLRVHYGDPVLNGVSSSAVFSNTSGTTFYSLYLSASRLSPCALCGNDNNNNATSVTCLLLKGSKSTSSFNSLGVPSTQPGSFEGDLPQPFSEAVNSSIPIERCALPASYWVWGEGAASIRTRLLLTFPSASVAANGAPLNISAVTLKPFFGGDVLGVTPVDLSGAGASIQLTYSPSLSDHFDSGGPGVLNLTLKDLKPLTPKLISSIPSTKWSTDITSAHQRTVTLTIDNPGPLGMVFVYPSPNVLNAVGSPIPFQWEGGPIVCPMTQNTTLTLQDLDGNVLTYSSPQDFFIKSSSQVLNSPPTSTSFLDITSANDKTRSWASAPLFPCQIISWSGFSSISSSPLLGQAALISMPAWIGSVNVSVFTMGVETPPISISYEAPEFFTDTGIYRGSTFNDTVLLKGKSFGSAASLGELWVKTGAAGVAAAITGESSRWPVRIDPSKYPHRVFFSYSGVDLSALGLDSTDPAVSLASRRYCQIQSWNDTLIQCQTPEGIAGSDNDVNLVHNYSLSTPFVPPTTQARGQFKYNDPTLVSASFDTVAISSPVLKLVGSGLSRFSSSPEFIISDPSQGFWRYSIELQGVASGSDSLGAVEKLYPPYAFTAIQNLVSQTFNNTQITVPLSVYLEGTIQVTLNLVSNTGAKVTTTKPVYFRLPTPDVTSIAAVASGTAGDDDYDPCKDLLNAPLILNTRAASFSGKCFVTIPSDYFSRAFLSQKFQPINSTNTSCFRTTPALISGTMFEIRGKHFGSGSFPPAIQISYGNVSQACIVIPPSPSNARATRWAPDTNGEGTLYCSLALDALSNDPKLPLGPSDIQFKPFYAPSFTSGVSETLVNGSVTRSISLTGVCPCGFFSEGLGSLCKQCTPRAFCLGGSEPPRAQANFYKTSDAKEQWKERNPGLDISQVEPYVACPTEGQCVGDNNCAVGSGGFMCTQCLTVDGVLYKRGASGVCEACNPFLSRVLVLSLVLGGLVGITLYLTLPWCLERTACCAQFKRVCYHQSRMKGCCCGGGGGERGGCTEKEGKALMSSATSREEEEEDRKAVRKAASRAPNPQALLPLIKIAITFFQTLGAVSLLLSSSTGVGREDPPNGLILPNLIKSLRVFTDFGFSLSQFKCAASLDYEPQLIVIICMPLACILLILPLLEGIKIGYETLQVGLHTIFSACLRQVHDPASTTTTTTTTTSPSPSPSPFIPYTIYPSSIATSLLFFILPSVISILATSQNCAPPTLGGYLIADPFVSCEQANIKSLLSLAKTFAILYIALPVGIALYAARGLPGYQLFAFLGRGYHEMSYAAKYWECVTLFRKAIVFGIATKLLYLRDPRSQIIAILLVLAFSVAFHFSQWPFGVKGNTNDALNWLDSTSIFACITVALSIMVRVASRLGQDLPVDVDQQNLLDVVAILFCLPFVLHWLFLLLDSLLAGGAMEVWVEATAVFAWRKCRRGYLKVGAWAGQRIKAAFQPLYQGVRGLLGCGGGGKSARGNKKLLASTGTGAPTNTSLPSSKNLGAGGRVSSAPLWLRKWGTSAAPNAVAGGGGSTPTGGSPAQGVGVGSAEKLVGVALEVVAGGEVGASKPTENTPTLSPFDQAGAKRSFHPTSPRSKQGGGGGDGGDSSKDGGATYFSNPLFSHRPQVPASVDTAPVEEKETPAVSTHPSSSETWAHLVMRSRSSSNSSSSGGSGSGQPSAEEGGGPSSQSFSLPHHHNHQHPLASNAAPHPAQSSMTSRVLSSLPPPSEQQQQQHRREDEWEPHQQWVSNPLLEPEREELIFGFHYPPHPWGGEEKK